MSELARHPHRRVYITGHRNPDTDSIAAAVGYAELKRRLDPGTEFVPVRLGDLNAQTRWVLERSGAPEPDFIEHVLLRVRDLMRTEFSIARREEPVREVGLTMARDNLDLVPVVNEDEQLVGVVTERALARRYIRESREASSLVDAPTAVSAVVSVLEGELLEGDAEMRVAGRVWVHGMEVGAPSRISEGDVVVVGDRPDSQRLALERKAALIVLSNGSTPQDVMLEGAREQGTAVVRSPLDTYVTARMITLAAPCRTLLDGDPLTVRLDDLIADVAEQIKEVHYRAAIAVDADRHPVGLVTRTDLLSPPRRRVILVDHAEQAQSVIGVEEAEIVEILDHHHVGSIETRVPVTAVFDPVGSTATLVVERFRQNGMEPSHPTAVLLLGAVLSDTVILNSPTTTARDHAVTEYLERVLAVDAREFGREMFEATSDVSEVEAKDIVTRDAKEYEIAGGHRISIAQIETVGKGLLDREDELLAALEKRRREKDYALAALMVTDILAQGTDLLVTGDMAAIERAFGERPANGRLELPGVMSRKKQVAPKLLGG